MDDEKTVAFKEVLGESGLACRILKKLGTVKDHPITGATCHYYLMKPVDDQEPRNLDPHENSEVRFVPVNELDDFIKGYISPAVMEMLTSPDVVEILNEGTR